MKPYKLKHVPTGLYYQPHKHRGSNLSEKGKIYQSGTHGLSSALRYAAKDKNLETVLFTVQCEKNSRVHKKTLDIITWKDCRFSRNQVIGATFLKDWIIEEI